MTPARHFLGWDRPVLITVTDWLLAQRESLPSMLVVVPTTQSGRRLREALARTGMQGVLAPRVCTPDQLFKGSMGAASRPLWLAAWAQAIEATAPGDLDSLFASSEDAVRDAGWGLRLGEMLTAAVETLGESGLTITDLLAQGAPLPASEPERWHCLEVLDRNANAILNQWGFVSPAIAKKSAASAPVLAPETGRVVLACVPDPVPLTLHALRASGLPIDILVHAPDSLASGFDEWGGPLPDFWNMRPISLPEGTATIQLVADPIAAAQAAVRFCSERTSDEVTLCVPDTDAVPDIVRAFAQAGWTLFDPEGKAAGQSGVALFADAIATVLSSAGGTVDRIPFSALVRLLKAPEAMHWMRLEGHRVALALDRAQEASLPETFADLERTIVLWRGRNSHAADADILFLALDSIRTLVADKPSVSDGVRIVCETLPDSAELELVVETLDLLQTLERHAPALALECWRNALGELRATAPRENAVLDAVGWLEAAYEPAPHLLLAGMHEGTVPDGRSEDSFLPDSLRAALGLRTRAIREARDSFLLSGMCASRASMRILVSKTNSKGDPRRPSSLLLRCAPEELPERVGHCFHHLEEQATRRPAPSRGPWLLDFCIDPARAKRIASLTEQLHPTRIGEFLRCPFRFYLKVVCGMERFDPEVTELDGRGFGNLLHNVLERFGLDSEIRDESKVPKISAWLKHELDRKLGEDHGKRLSLPLLVQREAARERLEAFAQRQAEHCAAGWRIRHVEYGVSPKADRIWSVAGVPVSMRIDRIDENIRDGNWLVLDYKTGAKGTGPLEAHQQTWREGELICGPLEPGKKKPMRWTSVQLPLYSAYLRDTLAKGRVVQTAYALLPGVVSETKFHFWENYDEQTEANALACAEAVLRCWREGIFGPSSPSRDKDLYDDFKPLFAGPAKDAITEATKQSLNWEKGAPLCEAS